MFITSGVSHQLISNQSYLYSTHPVPSIDSISNSATPPISHDAKIKHTLIDADKAHPIAYSAYAPKGKREVSETPYSEAVCQSASAELTSLVSIAVAHPGTWHQYKRRIQALQDITKSTACKAG